MDYRPDAVEGWKDALRRFADYRGELVEVLRWFGQEAERRMKANHPPGGPWPAPGAMPVFGENAYIDRTGWLTDSIGFTLEPYQAWTPGQGVASALPTLTIVATAPHASAVEYGVPGHSRPYPFFYETIAELMPEAVARIQAVMQKADSIRAV